jgi:hypothetical protein
MLRLAAALTVAAFVPLRVCGREIRPGMIPPGRGGREMGFLFGPLRCRGGQITCAFEPLAVRGRQMSGPFVPLGGGGREINRRGREMGGGDREMARGRGGLVCLLVCWVRLVGAWSFWGWSLGGKRGSTRRPRRREEQREGGNLLRLPFFPLGLASRPSSRLRVLRVSGIFSPKISGMREANRRRPSPVRRRRGRVLLTRRRRCRRRRLGRL